MILKETLPDTPAIDAYSSTNTNSSSEPSDRRVHDHSGTTPAHSDWNFTVRDNPSILPIEGSWIQYQNPENEEIVTAKVLRVNPAISKKWPGWRNVLIYPDQIKRGINLDIMGDNCLKWKYVDNHDIPIQQIDGNYTMACLEESQTSDTINNSKLVHREIYLYSDSNDMKIIVRNNLQITVTNAPSESHNYNDGIASHRPKLLSPIRFIKFLQFLKMIYPIGKRTRGLNLSFSSSSILSKKEVEVQLGFWRGVLFFEGGRRRPA